MGLFRCTGSLDGKCRELRLLGSVTGCRPAGRGINLNGIAPLHLCFFPSSYSTSFFMFHSFSRLFFSFFLFRSYWPSASVSQVRQRKWHCSADLLLLSTSEGVFLLHQLYFKEPSGCSLSSLRLTLDFFIPPNARNRRAREEKIYLKLWVQTQE